MVKVSNKKARVYTKIAVRQKLFRLFQIPCGSALFLLLAQCDVSGKGYT